MEKNWKRGGKFRCFDYFVCEEDASSLVFVSFAIVHVDRVETDLLVVKLQSSEVLPGLGELSLLHALPDVPVDEGPLGVHQVELVVEPGPGLHDGGGVGQAANRSLHLGEVAPGNDCWRLVVDPNLEPGGAPIHKLNCLLNFY